MIHFHEARGGDELATRGDGERRKLSAQLASGGLDLRRPHVSRVMPGLAMQVGDVDDIGVDQGESFDA